MLMSMYATLFRPVMLWGAVFSMMAVLLLANTPQFVVGPQLGRYYAPALSQLVWWCVNFGKHVPWTQGMGTGHGHLALALTSARALAHGMFACRWM